MTRVIAGAFGGRRLRTPPGALTRPTADRAREGLFSSLLSMLDLEGARVLDLYAGSGALGIEAVSRGAVTATLVDNGPAAVEAMRTNVRELGLVGVDVVAQEVERFLPTAAPSAHDLALVDPPYELDVDPVLAALVPALSDGAVVVVERRTRGPAPQWPAGLTADRSRRYGEATLWYGFRS